VQPKDGQAVGKRAAFARASCRERELGDAGSLPVRNEPHVRFEERFVAGRAFLDVRLHEDFAPRHEHTRDLVEERRTHDETLVMAFLPPGIGKVNEDARHAFGDEVREGVAGIFGEHAGPASEATIGKPPIDDGRPFSSNLEPHDANARILGETLEHEAAATRSDFELDRCVAAPDENPRVDGVFVGQARSVRVRIHGSGPTF
jgi:hypothetical protein